MTAYTLTGCALQTNYLESVDKWLLLGRVRVHVYTPQSHCSAVTEHKKQKGEGKEENIGAHLRSVPNHGGSGVAQLVAAGSFIVMDQEEVVLSNAGEGVIHLGGCVGQPHKRHGWGRSMVQATGTWPPSSNISMLCRICSGKHIFSTCERMQKYTVQKKEHLRPETPGSTSRKHACSSCTSSGRSLRLARCTPYT